MHAPLLFTLAAATAHLVNAQRNVTVQAQDVASISYTGGWLNNNDYCTSTRYTSTIGDSLSFTFTGTALFVIGTVDCDWSGLISISLDNATTTSFDRRTCVGDVCDYPWYTANGLSPTAHTLNITLTGPPVSLAPSKHIIADLRYISYTVPDTNTTTTAPIVTAASSPVTSSISPSPTFPSDSKKSRGGVSGGLIGGVVAGVVILLLLCIIAFLLARQKRKRQRHVLDLGPSEGFYDSPAAHAAVQPYAMMPWAADRGSSVTVGTTADAKAGRRSSRDDSSQVLLRPGTGTTPTTDTGEWNPYADATPSAIPDSSQSRSSGSRQASKLAAELLRAQGGQPRSAHPASKQQGIPMAPLQTPAHDADLVQRISSQVAAMLRESDAGPVLPPSYGEAARHRR